MNRSVLAAFTVASLALGAASAANAAAAGPAGAAAPAEAAPAAPPSPSVQFVTQAGQSDVYEQQAGQLAIQRGTNAGVKDLAAMLVVDHGRSQAEMAGAATAAGLNTTSPGLSPAQAAMVLALQNAPAAQFDSLFVTQQVQAHQQALALLNSYATGGDNPGLRAAAQKAIPMVQGHLDRAQALAAQVR